MKIRKITAVMLAAVMTAGLFSCTDKCDVTDAGSTQPDTTVSADTETAPADEYAGTLQIDVRPAPASAEISDKGEDSAPASLLSPSSGEYDDIFALFGFKTGAGGLPVSVSIDGSLGEEEYKLTVTKDAVMLTASGRRGVFAAVSTLSQLEYDGRLAAAVIEDVPAVAYRGVIEGFYGAAWTRQFRLDLFSFMGKYKLNTYIYAPKDDPKHRAEWRALYTNKEISVMKELVDTAITNNVRFVYAISPGLDIDLGEGYENDFAKLTEKCESIYGLGVRDFAILLDDIATFDAQGHAKLVNDFQSRFVKTHEGCSNLIMISPEFCEAMLTGYTNKLAPLLDPDIMVMWTGKYVLPQSISSDEIKNIDRKLGRNVFIWWNYPVNDTMADELFMGPCENLDGSLYKNISGLVSNPMNQGYASEVPLITISDFLWNPSAYDPEASVRAAVRLVEPQCADGLYALMDLTRNSGINGGKTSFSLSDLIAAYNKNGEGSAEALLAALQKTGDDLAFLSENCGKKLLSEIKPWLKKATLYVDAATTFLKSVLCEDENERASLSMDFVSLYAESAKLSAVVSPDVLAPFLSAARAKLNSAVGGGAVKDRMLKSTLNTYENYVPANALDGDLSTFYWTAGAPVNGSAFTVDLGAETEITGVRLLMGADSHADDYIRAGVIEYSSDGKNYTQLCDTTGRVTEKNASFSARYVRLRCRKEQIYWLIITEFEIRTKFTLPEGSSFDGSTDTDLSAMFDKDLFTAFRANPSALSGKTLSIDVSGTASARLYLAKPDGLRVYTVSADGKESEDAALSRYVCIDTAKAKYLCVVFGEQRSEISEIVLQ